MQAHLTKQNRYRARLREQGLRPIQIWVPDTRRDHQDLGIKRGDIMTATLSGDDNKAQHSPVIQSDLLVDHASMTRLPITSARIEDASLLRLNVEPTPENGLRKPSQVMIDKAHTLPRVKVGTPFGRLDDGTMKEITRALSVFLGIA